MTAFLWGVVVLAAIMLVYETMGGFRAVAWTDVIQGGVWRWALRCCWC
jgi:Na+/proline symporter